MRAIGIDIGSTSIKGAVLDLDSGTVGSPAAQPFPAPLSGLPAGWVEIDPAAISAAVDVVLASLLSQAPEATRVYLSGQMGGVILIDGQARPLTPYLSWRDTRTSVADPHGRTLLDHIRETWREHGDLQALGNELQPGSTSALLAWLKHEGALPHEATPATIADFVIARHIGRPTSMHATHAIGLLDLTSDEWHRPALERIGLGDLRLPPLTLDEQPVGEALVAGRRLRFFGSYGDQQCALRGAGLGRGELSINISTGSQLSRRVPVFQPGPYQTRRFFFGDYLDTITHIPGGRALNVLVDLLSELATAEGVSLATPWETIQKKVEDTAETDLQVDLAFFPSPVGERGSIDAIRTDNLRIGPLFLAAYQSMADNYAKLAPRFGPAEWSAVVMSGGLTQRAPRLRDLLQARFSAPLRESAQEETLLGLLDIARESCL